MDVLDTLEENAIKLESIAKLLASAPPDQPLESVQGALWTVEGLAREVRQVADRARMSQAQSSVVRLPTLPQMRQAGAG